MNFALPIDGLLERTAEIEEGYMRKAFAVALLFLMMISHSWADSFEVAPPPENWNKVQSLPLSTNITIELKHGGEISGEFIRLTEDSILLKEYAREKTYPKNAVARVTWMRPGSRARNAAIIGGIFFGIGFGLGYAAAPNIADQNNMPAGERASAGAAVGGLMGGAAAAISLAHRPSTRSEVIYRAR
jgi:hypothetical protein